MYFFIVLGDKWKIPTPVYYKMFKVIPHTHDMITVNVIKENMRFYNPKVFIQDGWKREQGDYQTLALGHKDIKPDQMYDLEEQRKNCVNEYLLSDILSVATEERENI